MHTLTVIASRPHNLDASDLDSFGNIEYMKHSYSVMLNALDAQWINPNLTHHHSLDHGRHLIVVSA